MDIRLPNGLVIRDVPDGTTKTQLRDRLSKQGYDLAELGLLPPAETAPPEPVVNQSLLRSAADLPVQFGMGLGSGIRAISDVFGANNPVSQNIRGVENYLDGLLSAQAKLDQQEVSRIWQEAQDKGLGEQVIAGLKAMAVSPADFAANALGTAVPSIAGGLAGAALKSIGGATVAMRAAAATKAAATIGGLTGAGITKQSIYESVKEQLSDPALGLSPDEIEARAQEAQSYTGENLDNILAGTAAGAVAGGLGIERAIPTSLFKSVGTEAAKKSFKSLMFAGLKEGVPEFVQAAHEQFAGNIAAQREGFDVPTMRGLGIASTLEGALGFGIGVGVDAVLPHPVQEEYKRVRADITNVADRAREEELRKAEEDHKQRFLKTLAEENERRVRGLSDDLNMEAEATKYRSMAGAIKPPTQQEVDQIAAPLKGEQFAKSPFSFGTVYGQKIARTLGDFFPNAEQFTVVQGETTKDAAGANQPTFRIVDSKGTPYGVPLGTFDQAFYTAAQLNNEVTNQNVRGAVLNAIETSGNSYDPETTQKLFTYGYRALHPDNLTFSALAVNEAAGTIGSNYAEGLSWKEVEKLPKVEIKAGKNKGKQVYRYSFLANNGQQATRYIHGLTKAQEINKRRDLAGKGEASRFSLDEVRSGLSPKELVNITKEFPPGVQDLPAVPLPTLRAVHLNPYMNDLLQSKNIASEVGSKEFKALMKAITGKDDLRTLDYGELRVLIKELGSMPRFDRPTKLPSFEFRPYTREQFAKASRFIQKANDRGIKPKPEEIMQAVGISKEDPRANERVQSILDHLKQQGVENNPPKPLALPAPPGANANLDALIDSLKKNLKGYGLEDVGLSLERNLISPSSREIAPRGTEGFFEANFGKVFLALDRVDPDGSKTQEQRLAALAEIMNHEIIHAVRNMDLWTNAEWETLKKATASVKKPGTNASYLQIAENLYADQNEEIRAEEAVADMFRDYAAGRLKVSGRPKALLQRLAEFFARIRKALGGTGFDTYQDVFNRLMSGEVGARERGQIRTARALDEQAAQQRFETQPLTRRQIEILMGRPGGPEYIRKRMAEAKPKASPAPSPTMKPEDQKKAVQGDFDTKKRFDASQELRESRESRDPTPLSIMINGRPESTLDSEGRLIYSGPESNWLGVDAVPTMEGLKNFWSWFKNSKAVDNRGRPLVYYHGTATDILAFRPKQAGSVFVTREVEFAQQFSRHGLGYLLTHSPEFMAPDAMLEMLNELVRDGSFLVPAEKKVKQLRREVEKAVAAGKPLSAKTITELEEGNLLVNSSANAKIVERYLPSNANIIPLYVSVQNPFDYQNKKHVQSVVNKVRDISPIDLSESEIDDIRGGDWTVIEGTEDNSPILDAIRLLGFDGMYIEESGYKNLAVFDPNQVKSAIGNNGRFGPSASLRESRGINVEAAPDPRNEEAMQAWNAMSEADKSKVTKDVGDAVIPALMQDLQIENDDYVIEYTLGGFVGETQPSVFVGFSDGVPFEKIVEASKALGILWKQQAVIAFDENDPVNGSQTQYVKLTPSRPLSYEEQSDLFKRINSAYPSAAGFSSYDGSLVFGNFTAFDENPVSPEDFHDAIDNAITRIQVDYDIVTKDFTFRSEYLDNLSLEGTRYGESDASSEKPGREMLRGKGIFDSLQSGSDQSFREAVARYSAGAQESVALLPRSVREARLSSTPIKDAVALASSKYKDYSTASEEEFFGRFWPRLLAEVRGTLPVTNRNIRVAAKRAIRDMEQWLRDNPRYVDYYHKDMDATLAVLQSVYQGVDADDFLFFRMAAGLTSPATALPGNIGDTVELFNLWKEKGNLDDIVLGVSPRRISEKNGKMVGGNIVVESSPVTLSGTTGSNKARTMKILDRLIKEKGSVTNVVNFLREGVTLDELQAFNADMGYKGPVADVNVNQQGPIQDLVFMATGQRELIPRMFIFGKKVGAYTLNLVGDSRYNTIDVWESRFIRSYFKDMFSKNTGIPKTVDESQLFQRFTDLFKEEYEKHTGQQWDTSALQAMRWFYILNSAKEAGYRGASTNETISEYTRRAFDSPRTENYVRRGPRLTPLERRAEEAARSAEQDARQSAMKKAATLTRRSLPGGGRMFTANYNPSPTGQQVDPNEAVVYPPKIRESRAPTPKEFLDQAVSEARTAASALHPSVVPALNPEASPEALYAAQNPEAAQRLTMDDRARYSRNNSVEYSPETKEVLGRITGEPPDLTPTETILNGMNLTPMGTKWRNWVDRVRQNLVNNYSRLEYYNKNHPLLVHLTAGASSIAAAELADRSKALSAYAMRSGVPVYKDGGYVVEPFKYNGKEVGYGLLDVMRPLYDNPGGSLEKLAQGYAIAKRGMRLNAEGKPTPLLPGDFEKIQREVQNHVNPETGRPIIEEWHDMWQAYNSHIIQFLKDTGVINEEGAKLWMENADYYPFYKIRDGEEDPLGARVFGGLTAALGFKKIKGSKDAINTPMLEAITLNMDAAIAMGMKNVAQQRIARDMINIGMGEEVNPHATSNIHQIVKFKVAGKNVAVRIDDPLVFESMQAVPEFMDLEGTLGKILQFPATALRELITREPGYMLANMMRDTIATPIVTGSNMKPVIDTVRKLRTGLDELQKYGVVGGIDFARDPRDMVKFLSDEARKLGFEVPHRKDTNWSKVADNRFFKPVTRLWDALGQMSDMSEAATRAAVFEDTMKRTGDWVQASYDALSVINYGRRGRNPGLRFITALVPFMNARIQGLDKLYQGATGQSGTSLDRRKNTLKFVVRAGMMLGLTAAYYAMVAGDDGYENETEENKDNYYIIPIRRADLANKDPGFYFKFPIPFEIGVLFKVIPERIMQLMHGEDTIRDFGKSMLRAATSTLVMNPVPQAVLPVAEVIANYDVFTGRPIVPYFSQNLLPAAQSRFTTNELAKRIGEALNVSPLKIDHLMNGYLGSLGTYFLSMVDSVLRESDRQYPQRNLWEYPPLKRFFTTALRPGLQEDFYDLNTNLMGIVQSMNTLKKEGRQDELLVMMTEYNNILALRGKVSAMDRYMEKVSAQRNAILRMEIDPEDKREMVDELDRRTAMSMKLIGELRRAAYGGDREAG